jgi:hypothetical protein
MSARTPIAGTIAGAAVGIAGVLVIALLYGTNADTGAVRDDTDAMRRLQIANTETLQLIKACTIEPAGRCEKLQREQAVRFVQQIALANSCTDRPGHQTPVQVERCIRKGIQE